MQLIYMSLCRPYISQVHIPKPLRRCFATSYAYATATAAARHRIVVPNVRLSDGVYGRGLFSKTTSRPSPSTPHSYSSMSSTKALVSDIQSQSIILTAKEYYELRSRDPSLVAQLPATSFLHISKQATKNKSPELANLVASDILELYQGGDAERVKILRTILSHDVSFLSRDILLRFLQQLQQSPDGIGPLTTNAVEHMARIVSDTSAHPSDRPLLRLLHPILLEHLKPHYALGGIQSVTYHPPGIIYAAFATVHKLLVASLQPQALDIFQVLSESRQIPPEALQGADDSSGDFKQIICTALVKSCLHWNWRSLATIILTDVIDTSPTLDPSIIDLNTDVIYALLDTPNHRDIRACGNLIRLFHKHTPVPDSVIRQFYNISAEKLATEEAEAMYAFTRSDSVLGAHHYPPPQGAALPWLMFHFTSASRQTHLSRVLATEVVDDHLPIPLLSRAQFIAATAAQGYGKLSRALWERFATGADKSVILGNPALMIRMTSLFANLSKRTDVKLRRQQSEKFKATDVNHEDDDALRTRSEDFVTFLDRVVLAFRAHHEPLAEAPHRVLTSLARACFIIGKFADGFSIFQILLDRKEIPDLYDVNVALSAVAEVEPRQASRMIERMTKSGIKPDAVTIGTVMNQALLHRDRELVDDMIRELQRLEDKRLTLKSMAGLINATVTPMDNEPKHVQRSKLQDALHIIKTFPDTNLSLSSQTGKRLVYASLHVEDPVLAYTFWNLVLRHSAEWNDTEQRTLRRLIGQMINKYRRQLDSTQVAAMLSHLRPGA